MSKARKSAQRINYALHAAIIIPIAVLAGVGWAAYNPISGFAAKTNLKQLPLKQLPTRETAKVSQLTPRDTLFVKMVPLKSTTLTNTDQDVFKFQAKPENTKGPLGLKQIVFTYRKSLGVSLHSFRIRKGSADLPLASYVVASLENGKATDIETGYIPATSASGYIVVSFTNEETIEGLNGNTYTLHASISGATYGKSVSLTIANFPSAVGNGYLTHSTVSPFPSTDETAAFGLYNLDTSVPAEPLSAPADMPGFFLWTDRSSPNHSDALGLDGGSSDWFNSVQTTETSTLKL